MCHTLLHINCDTYSRQMSNWINVCIIDTMQHAIIDYSCNHDYDTSVRKAQLNFFIVSWLIAVQLWSPDEYATFPTFFSWHSWWTHLNRQIGKSCDRLQSFRGHQCQEMNWGNQLHYENVINIYFFHFLFS